MNGAREGSAKSDSLTQKVALIAGPVLSACLLLFFDLDPGHPEVTYTAAVALLMAIWWITEAIPLAVTVKLNPLLLMIPGTLACSCAFMLPVATPPNAIIFGTQRLRIADMAEVGFLLNLIGVVVITVATCLLGRLVLGTDMAQFPAWAAVR